jgi:hypothetical protein
MDGELARATLNFAKSTGVKAGWMMVKGYPESL